ncbi:MAG: DNA alkylation repair protein [Lachnospiraceae bacterium]|nr:DNA alkylation repair protein [Lachnospiraceae bacterium]
MYDFITYLEETIPEKDSLKVVKTEAQKFYHSNPLEECLQTGYALWKRENFQLQEVGVLLLGYCAHEYPEALSFLRETVSRHKSWKVQEILAMAFDNHCKIVGYEQALPLIREWLSDENANVRRAVAEGLRIWTNRSFFRENPRIAVELLAERREDGSEYVRKSAGNALRDISRKHPELILEELKKWNLSSKKVRQVYQLAGKFVMQNL